MARVVRVAVDPSGALGEKCLKVLGNDGKIYHRAQLLEMGCTDLVEILDEARKSDNYEGYPLHIKEGNKAPQIVDHGIGLTPNS